MKFIIAFLLLFSAATLHAQHAEVPPTNEFKITGIVKKELSFSIKDILGFKQDSLGNVVIRNKRGEEKSVANNIKGVLLKNVLDSAGIVADKPKEYSEFYITLIASDGYKNVYSWNELFNNEAGNHVYIVTEMDGKPMDQMYDRILVLSLSDINSGRRHLKGLAKIEVKKVE